MRLALVTAATVAGAWAFISPRRRLRFHSAMTAMRRPKKRMLSVYFPDEKHPMLPQSYLAAYSFKKGEARAALSQYFLFDAARGVKEGRALLLGKCFSVR